jgi:arsenate reductase (glutaredoxin)
MILYGIPNCDTVKKARAWLTEHGHEHRFHDHRKDGVEPARLAAWCAHFGWETVLNRAGTTFRALPEQDRADLDSAKAQALMLAQPGMIKRPIVEHDGGLLIGFKADDWAKLLG